MATTARSGAAKKAAPAKKTTARKATTKPVEPVEDDFEDEDITVEDDPIEDDGPELEDDDFDEVEEVAPVKKAPAKKASGRGRATGVTFGVSDVCKLIGKKTGTTPNTREVRGLIRRMAKDGRGRIDREIVPGNRTPYDWTGPKDPEVVAIIKAWVGGEAEEAKKEALDALKTRGAAAKKAAEARTSAKKPTRRKAAPEPVEDDEDLDFDDED